MIVRVALSGLSILMFLAPNLQAEPGAAQHKPIQFQPRVATDLRLVPLIEAISETEMYALADPSDADGDGISGRVHDSFSVYHMRAGLGRYGWKASAVTLEDQILAGLHEQSAGTPEQNQSNILEISKEVRLLDVPIIDHIPISLEKLGCANCHAHNKGLFSNLLLHDMGTQNADNRSQGFAKPSEWRTAPLRFLSGRSCYLHDCRAKTIKNAIIRHGGEARQSKWAFLNANSAVQAELLAWLAQIE